MAHLAIETVALHAFETSICEILAGVVVFACIFTGSGELIMDIRNQILIEDVNKSPAPLLYPRAS